MKSISILLLVGLSILLFSCSNIKEKKNRTDLETRMDSVANNYVKLVLKIGKIDPGYVDAYYGPKDWEPSDKLELKKDSSTFKILNNETNDLLDSLDALGNYDANEIQTLRYRFLYKQLLAVKARLFMLAGGSFSFDQESKALYDAVAPTYSDEHFQNIINELNEILPGKGSINKRLVDFRKDFIIPKSKLDTVFKAAIAECRKRTLDHITLPKNEKFKVEYVTNKPWSGYNWYKGNDYSVIQVNTDLPIYIDRAIDLAAHEGYPGHHVYNSLLENKLVKQHGWMEFTVYPLYSPQSLIAEGTANFGIKVAFPGSSRIQFEKNVLFPLAGLDTSKAAKYYEVLNLLDKLNFAGNKAARNFLDHKWTKKQTIDWLEKYNLMTSGQAEHRLSFIEHYRSYVINYNVGQEIVKNYIDSQGGTANHPEKRWDIFKFILSTPQTPSGLVNKTK